MRAYRFAQFGLEHLRLEELPEPRPAAGEVVVEVKAASLNYRDLLVIQGLYNPRLRLPAVPLSDGAGVVVSLGEGVKRLAVGDRVVSHYLSTWQDGPYRAEYLPATLGAPGPGLAAQRVALPAEALVPIPAGLDFAEAATLPIAALTAWSALVCEGGLRAGQTVLTLGTGGVSIFALQFAKALGARVVITSSRDEKLERARRLGADHGINYRDNPDWDKAVLDCTDGAGADVTVETAGAGTVDRSLAATRAGGTIALIGVLSGRRAEVTTVAIIMKRLKVAGILVGSRAEFERMNRFVEQHHIRPVIDRPFAFEQLPDALRFLEAGQHFGKIVIDFY